MKTIKNYEWTRGDLLVLLIGCRRSVKVKRCAHTIAVRAIAHQRTNECVVLCAQNPIYAHGSCQHNMGDRRRACAQFSVLSLSRMQINCRLADKQCNSIWLLLLATTVTATALTTGKLFISFAPSPSLAELCECVSFMAGGDDRALFNRSIILTPCFRYSSLLMMVRVTAAAFIPAFYGKFIAIKVQSDAKNNSVIAIKLVAIFGPKWYCFCVRFELSLVVCASNGTKYRLSGFSLGIFETIYRVTAIVAYT